MPKKKNKFNFKYLALSLLIIILIGGGAFVYTHDHDKTKTSTRSSTQLTAKGNISTSTNQPSQNQTPSNKTSVPGGVIDQNGQTSGSLPPSSEWVSSSNGAITLQQPTANSTVATGDTLSGLAQVNNVQFILTDNSVGLIAQGNLSVVNGKFSGILQFSAHSNSGKLEVYYPNPSNGAEEDIIEVNVNFSS